MAALPTPSQKKKKKKKKNKKIFPEMSAQQGVNKAGNKYFRFPMSIFSP
jgi:hypothetical protein